MSLHGLLSSERPGSFADGPFLKGQVAEGEIIDLDFILVYCFLDSYAW